MTLVYCLRGWASAFVSWMLEPVSPDRSYDARKKREKAARAEMSDKLFGSRPLQVLKGGKR